MQIKKIFEKNIVYILLGFSGLMLTYFTIASMNTTVYLSEYERCFYCKDNPFVHLIFIAFIVGIFFFIKKHNIKIDKKSMLWIKIAIISVYIATLFFVLYHIRLLPIFDQNKVFQIALNMSNYNYTDFLKGEYGEKWTNQWGYLYFLMAEFKLFGLGNLNAIYSINVIFMAGIIWAMYGFAKRYLNNDSVLNLIAVCLFIPLWSFSVFLYGNIPSCFFGIIAFNFLYDFLKENNTLEGLLGVICIVVSVILKTTHLIFLIAFLIYLLIQKTDNKNILKRAVLLVSCLLLYVVSNKCIHSYTEHVTGMTLGNGVPRTAHIAMGMHESSDSAGWYDGFVDSVYEDNDYDHDRADNAAVTDLKDSLNRFKYDPTGAIGLFSRKLSSQWIEPTYESIFILLNRHPYADNGQYPVNDLPINALGKTLMWVMNLLQSLIYFGSFAFCASMFIDILKNKKQKIEMPFQKYFSMLFPLLVVLGGFVFYIFWEANSQYSLFFILILVPCAVSGYDCMAEHIVHMIDEKATFKKVVFSRVVLLNPIVVLSSFIILMYLLPDMSFKRVLAPSWSEEQYEMYLSELKAAGPEYLEPITDRVYESSVTDNDDKGSAEFPAGRYYIQLACNPEQYIVPWGNDLESPLFAGQRLDNRVILTSTEQGYNIRFQITQKVMDVRCASFVPGTQVQQYESNGDLAQLFHFESNGDGKYWIVYVNELVLTVHDDCNITIEPKDDTNPMQLWTIIPE